MTEAVLESGFAKVEAGSWLSGRGQPAAFAGALAVKGLKGFIVPDRAALQIAESTGAAWFARADAPFLARLDALPDRPLKAVSSKLLVAPAGARKGGRSLKLVPLSLNRAQAVTELQMGWSVMATKSRVTRVSLEADEALSVKPESLVAWIGKDPSGFCPRLSIWDMLLPRGPKSLVFVFHGPATVWFEGAGTGRPVVGPYRRGGLA